MRGVEQHVERKIRLWVVQQERVRLLSGQRGGLHARTAAAPGAASPSPTVGAEAATRLDATGPR